MASDESSGSGSGVPGGRRRRPPSTIELEATEVASEPGATGDSAAPSQPEPDPAAEPEPPQTRPIGEKTGRRQKNGAWRLIGAGIGGAAIAGLVLGGLWTFGVLPYRAVEPGNEWTGVSAKVAGLERQVRELAAPTPAAPDRKRTEEIDARLTKLEAAAAAASQAQKADAQTAANPAERGELDALAARLTSLEQQLKAAEQRLGKVAAGADRTVRLALVAMELRTAVERGIAFTAALQAAKQLAENPSALAALEASAATGVPSPAALAQNLSKLAPAMLEAASAPRREAGVMERLQASAERLVRIRPVEEASGDEPSTMVARAELKATRGDIAGALADLERLPEPVRAPAAGWIAAAKARLAAIDAAKALTANALDALARPAE
ncbi:MAG: hypothetical protein E6G88_07175 [Alphaproteobacteria bacterium]|nr:MAG: hypothetical protein E6G88_07175 [Alphaproteobacteria bacterium]